MKAIHIGLQICVFVVGFFSVGISQTFEVRLTQSIANANDTVNVEIRRTGGTSFVLATSSFFFNYNTAALFAPVKVAAYDGPWDNTDGDYLNVLLSRDSVSGYAGLTVEFQGGDDEDGAVVPTTFTRVGSMRFPVKNPSLLALLQWRNIGGNTQVLMLTDPGVPFGGQTDITANGTFIAPIDPPLPITLSSFTGTVLQNGGVRLDWITLSEIENFGFNVQRKRSNEEAFVELPNSFIQGHGTTNEPQTYTFTDATVTSGTWQYRLKQIDMSGPVHYTDPIQVDVTTTGVKEAAPVEFALLQNYPNPFNPSTEIKFSVEATGPASVKIFNLIGQEVATLFEGMAEAGQYYKVKLDAANLPSGVYFYRLQNQNKSELRKMILLK